MNLALISAVAGLATVLLVFSIIVTLSTLEDLHLRDWLTLWPYQHWLGEFKAMFNLKIYAVGAALFSFTIYGELRSAGDVDASEGKCACHCKACKESLRSSRAAAACPRLEAKTNSVAKPASK